LEERLRQLGLGAATAVDDTGKVPVVNRRQVGKSGISYVSSVPPSQHPELLAVPLASFQPAGHPRLSGIHYSADQQMILRRQRLVVQTHSPTLASGQLAGLRQHLAKAQAALSELQARLQRASRRKPSDPETLHHEIDGILSGPHLRQVVTTKLEADAHERQQLQFAVDEERVTHLVDHLFGRRLWITNHLDWEPARVILAARGQSEAEEAFRQLHAERAVAWSPMWPWSDQKIQVHGLYRVLGVMLVCLLQHRAAAVGDTREPRALIADPDEVTESLLT
jgi:transposase